MRILMLGIVAGIGLLATTANGQTDTVAQECKSSANLPRELASWSAPVAVRAAMAIGSLRYSPLQIGQAGQVALNPVSAVRFPLRPEKAGALDGHGGLLGFQVPRTGKYRIALGTAAWIDVLHDGHALISTRHGHGPDCSGIHKMVDFDLGPGQYTLQISGSEPEETTILVARIAD